jgi:hypothetical protein
MLRCVKIPLNPAHHAGVVWSTRERHDREPRNFDALAPDSDGALRWRIDGDASA